MTVNTPSADQIEDVVLACRYGDEDSMNDILAFVQNFGVQALESATDEYGNSCLHMAAANGNKDIVDYLIKTVSPAALVALNDAGNTPLHWAAINAQLEVLRLLTPLLSVEQLILKNKSGKTAYNEAEDRATEKSFECAGYILAHIPETEEEKEARLKQEAEEEISKGVQGLKTSSQEPASEESEKP